MRRLWSLLTAPFRPKPPVRLEDKEEGWNELADLEGRAIRLKAEYDLYMRGRE